MVFFKQSDGFTLVEIAISLIIIALLLGLIIQGREIIENARITKTASEMNYIDQSVEQFFNVYKALPGDMSNPSQRLENCSASTACGAASGNMNMRIEPTPGEARNAANIGNNEATRVFLHLAAADLIDNLDVQASPNATGIIGETVPSLNFNGHTGLSLGYAASERMIPTPAAGGPSNYSGLRPNISNSNDFVPKSVESGHYMYVTDTPNTDTVYMNTRANGLPLKPKDVMIFDIRIDDGTPNTGDILAAGATSVNESNIEDSCVSDTSDTAIYNSSNENALCGFYKKMSFSPKL